VIEVDVAEKRPVRRVHALNLCFNHLKCSIQYKYFLFRSGTDLIAIHHFVVVVVLLLLLLLLFVGVTSSSKSAATR